MLQEQLEQNKGAKAVFLCGRGSIRQHWELAERVFLLKVDADTMIDRLNRTDRDNDFAKIKKLRQNYSITSHLCNEALQMSALLVLILNNLSIVWWGTILKDVALATPPHRAAFGSS